MTNKSQLFLERRAIEAQFATENWSQMNFTQRLDACRRLEENYAAENGVQPSLVTFEYMDGASYGYQNGNTITLNAYILDEGTFHTLLRDENGHVLTDESGMPMESVVPIRGSNWATMESVYHEGTHGIQEAQGRLSNTYIKPEADYSLYRIQACEREAFATSQYRTLDAIQYYQDSSGQRDPAAIDYARSVQRNSYNQYYKDAAARYHDANIEQTVDQFVSDHDRGIYAYNASNSYEAVSQVYEGREPAIMQGVEIDSIQAVENFSFDDVGEHSESSQSESNVFDFNFGEDVGLSSDALDPAGQDVSASEGIGVD